MKSYIHCGVQGDYEISEQTNNIIQKLNKEFGINKIYVDECETDQYTPIPDLEFTIRLQDYEIYVKDIKKEKMIFKRCRNLKLENKYLKELQDKYLGKIINEINGFAPINNDNLAVSSSISKKHKNSFVIHQMLLSEDEEHDEDFYIETKVSDPLLVFLTSEF